MSRPDCPYWPSSEYVIPSGVQFSCSMTWGLPGWGVKLQVGLTKAPVLKNSFTMARESGDSSQYAVRSGRRAQGHRSIDGDITGLLKVIGIPL